MLKILTTMVSISLYVLFLPSVDGYGNALADPNRTPWVIAEGVAPIADGDEESAKELALQRAHRQAIKKSLGQGISIESLTVNLRLSGTLAGSIPHCRIVESKILETGPHRVADPMKVAPPKPIYRLKMKATIAEAQTKADPDFFLDAELNQTQFREGEKMVIKIVPSKPCYCYIYVVLDTGRIIQLMPNRIGAHHRVRAGQPLLFPDDKAANPEIALITHLPTGKRTTIETIFIVALKNPVRLSSVNIEEGIYSQYEAKSGRFGELVSMIATIPPGERTEKILPYQIVKREP